MATHSSILAWEIPWTEAPGGLQSTRLQESYMSWRLNHYHRQNLHARKERASWFIGSILQLLLPFFLGLSIL